MNKIEIENWLKLYGIENYTILEDLSVDVNGDVDLFGKSLVNIPVKFRNISGDFDCGKNGLTNLDFCPVSVGGNFFCYKNILTSMVGCPSSVGGDFDCGYNKLTNLFDCPVEVGGEFNCSANELLNLIGSVVKVGGGFACGYNHLNSLEGIPIVNGIINCRSNDIDESELFLCDYTSEQIRSYYENKNLNEKLKGGLSEKVDVGIKKNKL